MPENIPINQQPEWPNNPPTNHQENSSVWSSPGVFNYRDGTFLGPISDASFILPYSYFLNTYDESIVCQKHRTTMRNTITFTANERSETYCLVCIMDMLREKISPVGQSDSTAETKPAKEIQLFASVMQHLERLENILVKMYKKQELNGSDLAFQSSLNLLYGTPEKSGRYGILKNNEKERADKPPEVK
jgi:hypothetical protein